MFVTNVLASHYPGSFTSALLERFTQGLRDAGHRYENFDLYAESFDPVMKGDDFNQFFGRALPPDILRIQEVLKKSDVLVFFYPVWWNDMPAIMKGWIDRVFSKGFAFDYDEQGTRGLLPCRKVILVCTLGNSAGELAEGLERAMRDKERHGVFGYCGVPEVEHHFLYGVKDETAREKYLDALQDMGRNL